MITKDILRIALIVLFVLFALRSGSHIRVRGSVRINRAEETEDQETQQLLQHLKDTVERIKQKQKEYENKNVLEAEKSFNSGSSFSAGAVLMIIALLMILM